MTRVYLRWLGMYLATPRTKLRLDRYAKYASHRWHGRRWPWVDPMAEARSSEIARNYGWRTDDDIAANLGEDIEENILQIRKIADSVQGTYLEVKYATQPEEPAPGVGA
jgi:capsid protein